MIYHVFNEFDAYEDAFQHAQVRMTLHRRESRRWALGNMSLGRLHLQWGTSGGGMVTEGEIRAGGHALFIPLSNLTTNGVNGCRLSESTVMVAESGSEFCVSADRGNDWCSLFVPGDLIGNNTHGMDKEPLSGCRVANFGSRQLREVRQAVRRLINLGMGQATLPADHAGTVTMLQQFAEAAIVEKHPDENIMRGRPRLKRHEVIRLVKDELALKSNQTSYIGELADAAEVSERTLLRIFHDWYGISPAQYARLRNTHAVRDALLAADPRTTTVTAILTQHGVNQFGRFAGVYQALFGESPSETLSRDKR